MQEDVVDLLECPNCSTPLTRRYCPQCGQRIGDINPTMHDLLHDVTHEFRVPISALIVQLATRRSGRNYPQHLSFALHIHAAFFALLTATILVELLNVNWLSAAASLSRTALLVGYTVVAFHQAYGGAWGVAVGRTAVVLTGYMLVIAAATLLSVAVYAASR